MLMFASNVYHVYLNRLICGFGGGATMIVLPNYLSTIDEKL